MLQFWRIKGINIPRILLPYIESICPEVNYQRYKNDPNSQIYKRIYNKIIGGAYGSITITAIYADLIKHKLTEEEFKIAIYAGGLMIVIDDFFDNCKKEDVALFIKFTSDIMKSTIKGLFPTDDDTNYFLKHYPKELQTTLNETNSKLNKLAFHLYCDMIRAIEKNQHLKNNLVLCLQRTQYHQEESLMQKKVGKLNITTLERISADKGGYSALLGGYIIDSNLPSVTDEDLFSYSKMSLNQLDIVSKDNGFNNLFFWRRQFLYETGAFIQYLDDIRDVEEDRKLGIETFVSRNPLNTDEGKAIKKRILSIYERAFKNDLSFINYYLSLIVFQNCLDQCESLIA